MSVMYLHVHVPMDVRMYLWVFACMCIYVPMYMGQPTM